MHPIKTKEEIANDIVNLLKKIDDEIRSLQNSINTHLDSRAKLFAMAGRAGVYDDVIDTLNAA